VDRFLFKEHHPIVHEWMRGAVSSEDVNQLLCFFLKISYRFCWETFVHDCRTMNVSITHLRRIQELRDFFVVVLMTGNMDCFDRFTVPALGLDDYFDKIVNSSSTGLLKSDRGGEMFLSVCRSYGADIRGSILIDDSGNNCSLFQAMGGSSFPVSTWSDLTDALWFLFRQEVASRGALVYENGEADFPPFRVRHSG
jgi:hypothetical protein